MDTPGLSQVCPEQDFQNMIGFFFSFSFLFFFFSFLFFSFLFFSFLFFSFLFCFSIDSFFPSLSKQHRLFQEMQKMDKINVIIVVLSLNSRYTKLSRTPTSQPAHPPSITRFDHQTLHTLKYYQALLQPVFWHGSVFLGVPNFNQRRLDELLEDLDDLDEVWFLQKKKTLILVYYQ